MKAMIEHAAQTGRLYKFPAAPAAETQKRTHSNLAGLIAKIGYAMIAVTLTVVLIIMLTIPAMVFRLLQFVLEASVACLGAPIRNLRKPWVL